jgi:hypothetical protein
LTSVTLRVIGVRARLRLKLRLRVEVDVGDPACHRG